MSRNRMILVAIGVVMLPAWRASPAEQKYPIPYYVLHQRTSPAQQKQVIAYYFVLHPNETPQWTAEERKRGFVVCTDHWMRAMFDVFVPRRDQVVDQLACALARGEYESIQIGVHALKDLASVEMTVELDLPLRAYRFEPIDRAGQGPLQ